MFAKDKVLDDIARLAGSGIGVLSGLQRQIREEIRSYMDDMAARMDLIPREEFERLELMLQEARTQQTALEKRVTALEGKKKKPAAKTKTTKPKPKTVKKKS